MDTKKPISRLFGSLGNPDGIHLTLEKIDDVIAKSAAGESDDVQYI